MNFSLWHYMAAAFAVGVATGYLIGGCAGSWAFKPDSKPRVEATQ